MPAATYTPGSGFGIVGALATTTTIIGNIHEIRPNAIERPTIETTHMTTTGGWRTYIPGDLKDAGTIAMDVEYNTQIDYKSLIAAQTNETYTVTFPLRGNAAGAATKTFSAVITKASPSWPKDDLIMTTLEFKVSGSETYTAATT